MALELSACHYIGLFQSEIPNHNQKLTMSALKFDIDEKRLYNEIREQVSSYFKKNDISPHANHTMVTKTIVLLTAYFGPYLIMLNNPLPVITMWLLTGVMGLAIAGIGMSIMHDACHGSYSSKPLINKILGYSINLMGGNRFNWIIQHNVKHHTFTNIYGVDEDLSNGDVIRLSPFSDYKWFHKFQHIYTWMLYLLGTLSWVTIKDFKQFKQLYNAQSHIKNNNIVTEVSILILSKVLYYVYVVVIPYLILDLPLWQIFVGFITIHFVAGFVLSVTFQLAHIVENTEHVTSEPLPNLESWAIHQIKTTCNFARKSTILNWYLGGLNFQIEHHLFPNVCHVHYRKISEIVKNIVQKHGLTYNEYDSMLLAVKSHYSTLKKFATQEPAVLA